jgi:hypothetical protein
MRKLLLALALLLPIQINAQEFDVPIKVSWNTEKGVVSQEIYSEAIIKVSNALFENKKRVSFNLNVTVVVRDEINPQLAHIGYWCVVDRLDDVEYISVSEADIISVSNSKLGQFDCGFDFKVNLEWVNRVAGGV